MQNLILKKFLEPSKMVKLSYLAELLNKLLISRLLTLRILLKRHQNDPALVYSSEELNDTDYQSDYTRTTDKVKDQNIHIYGQVIFRKDINMDTNNHKFAMDY